MLFVCLPPAEHEGPCPMYAHNWWTLGEYPDEECWETMFTHSGRGVAFNILSPIFLTPYAERSESH